MEEYRECVHTLADQFFQAGTHSVVFDASSLASGMYYYYYYTLQATKHVLTGHIMLVK